MKFVCFRCNKLVSSKNVILIQFQSYGLCPHCRDCYNKWAKPIGAKK